MTHNDSNRVITHVTLFRDSVSENVTASHCQLMSVVRVNFPFEEKCLDLTLADSCAHAIRNAAMVT